MRDPTRNEIFLQNLLATSSTLLYRAIQPQTPSEKAGLIIEVNTWFRETRVAITQALEAQEDVKAIVSPARPVENNGQNWKSPANTPDSTASSTPVPPTATNTDSAAQSSNPSSGGNSSPEKKPFKSYLLNF